MPESDQPSGLMTLLEVAQLLDTSQSFVAQLVAREAIPFERPQGNGLGKYRADELRFRREAVEKWLESR
jgi:excisionase family DNA binding protein